MSPTKERRDAGQVVSRQLKSGAGLQALSIFLIFRIRRLGNRHPAIAGDACPDAYVLAFSCRPVPTPVQYGANHRLPRMILIRLGRTAYGIPMVLVRHTVQPWAEQLIQDFGRNVVSPAVMGHLEIPNTWQRESHERCVVDHLLQCFTPGIASKHDAMTVQDSRLHHTHFILTTGRLRREIFLAPQGLDVGGRGLHCPEYAAQRAIKSTFFDSFRCLRGVHDQVC